MDKREMTVRDWAKQAKQMRIVDLLDKMEEWPVEWHPDSHANFPRNIKNSIEAFLLAAKSAENKHLEGLPQEILLKIVGQYARLELWPMLTDAN